MDSSCFVEGRGIYFVEEQRTYRVRLHAARHLRFLGNGYSVMGYGYERSHPVKPRRAARDVARFNRERWKLRWVEASRGISHTKIAIMLMASFPIDATLFTSQLRKLNHLCVFLSPVASRCVPVFPRLSYCFLSRSYDIAGFSARKGISTAVGFELRSSEWQLLPLALFSPSYIIVRSRLLDPTILND